MTHPARWRQGSSELEGLLNNAAPMSRAEILRVLDDTMSADERKKIRLKRVLGSASIKTVVLVELEDGREILVAPGIYFENVVLDRDLELIGTGGQEVTILDGSAASRVVTSADASEVGWPADRPVFTSMLTNASVDSITR